jgi:hypothetical protein
MHPPSKDPIVSLRAFAVEFAARVCRCDEIADQDELSISTDVDQWRVAAMARATNHGREQSPELAECVH